MNRYLERGDHRAFLVEPDGIGSLSQDGLREAMEYACKTGAAELIDPIAQLLDQVDFRLETNGWTPLHLAIEMDHVSTIEALLKCGADPNAPDNSGASPLHLAVDMEADTAYQANKIPSPEISALLIKWGADVERPDRSGATPRRIAEDYDYAAFLELIGNS